jgi:fused signal recognition particle receptor
VWLERARVKPHARVPEVAGGVFERVEKPPGMAAAAGLPHDVHPLDLGGVVVEALHATAGDGLSVGVDHDERAARRGHLLGRGGRGPGIVEAASIDTVQLADHGPDQFASGRPAGGLGADLDGPGHVAMVAHRLARDWRDLIITDDAPDVEPVAAPGEPPGGLFSRLRAGLSRTRAALTADVAATLSAPVDEHTWESLEEALILADVGVQTTAKVVARLEEDARSEGLDGGEALTSRLTELLAETATVGEQRIDLRPAPTVILAVGVNGTGKTTTVGKLAWHLQHELARKVLLAAADTFRAAGPEQLEGWAERAGCDLVRAGDGADPGAVAFDAISQAAARGADVVIVDTAGRLHTQRDLMEELAKVRRVIAKQIPGAPHETLLTVDATTGQNGLRQARLFADAIGVDGIVLTKLDGTAKGGIALAIAGELGIPVKLIGVGEALEDLRPFDPADFARALLS